MRCDAEGFARMYGNIYRDLFRFALCMMKNEYEAEDAVSEAVVKAWENIRKLRREDAFRNWMFTILANTCRKKLKENSRRREQEIQIDDAAGNDPGMQNLEDAACHMALDLKKAFFILSEEEREIVSLSVFGGYNSKEIGKILRLNANTVRSKRKRALEKMACVLD